MWRLAHNIGTEKHSNYNTIEQIQACNEPIGFDGIYRNVYENKELLKDIKWKKKRQFILDRDNWTCVLCGSSNKRLNIHHKKYFKDKMPWEYPDDLLITVCKECHTKIHKKNDDEQEDD